MLYDVLFGCNFIQTTEFRPGLLKFYDQKLRSCWNIFIALHVPLKIVSSKIIFFRWTLRIMSWNLHELVKVKASLKLLFLTSFQINIFMRSIQELFFSWVGWDGTLYNFQTDKNIALLHYKGMKKKLIYLNSHRYFVVYFLNTSKQR